MLNNREMVVAHIDNQGDRVLLYRNTPSPENANGDSKSGGSKSEGSKSSDSNYYVIAPTDCMVQVGDTIKYEPFGWNFGWFVQAVDSKYEE